MSLGEIVSTEKIKKNDKVEKEVKKMKYYDEVMFIDNAKKGVE